MRSASAIVVLAGCAQSVVHEPSPQPVPTAREVLDAAAATYARATSYSDRGRDRILLRAAAGRHERVLTFATAFARAGDFRFEFYNDGDPSKSDLIWRDARGVHSRWYAIHDKEEQFASLDLALGAAAGISLGSSHTVPRLLMPSEIEGWSLLELRELELRLQPTSVGGHICWKLIGRDPHGERVVVWIDCETYLVRRIETSHHIAAKGSVPEFTFEQTTTYDPSLAVTAEALSRRPEALPQPPPPPWFGIAFNRNAQGARVTSVIPDSPAAHAGIAAGDEIVALDGRAIATSAEVVARVSRANVGARLVATVSRTGQTLDIPVTLEARPDMRKLGYTKLINLPAPNFDLPVASNTGSAKLSDLAGNVILIDFWATWCGPCEAAVPRLEELHQKYAARGLSVIGISDDDAADIATYAHKHAITYPLARDAGGTVARAYWQAALPMVVVIDRAGVVREIDPGSDLEARVVDLLK